MRASAKPHLPPPTMNNIPLLHKNRLHHSSAIAQRHRNSVCGFNAGVLDCSVK